MKSQRIAIIGGVAAGTAAAAAVRRTDPSAQVTLFEQGPDISYGACELPGLLSGRIVRPEELVHRTPEAFAAERGIEVLVRTRVDSIDAPSGKLQGLSLESGEIIHRKYDKFILATGAKARIPDFDGWQAPNVFVLRELTDARAITNRLGKDTIHHAVVIGAGFVGLEVAEALVERGIRVTMVDPAPGPLHTYLESELSAMLAVRLKDAGVFLRQETLTGFTSGPSGSVQAVDTAEGERIGCQLVILAMGTDPETALGKAMGVRVGRTGAFNVSSGMRTNLPNVWACGDCVEVHRLIDDCPIRLPLSLMAFRTGRVAGVNAVRRGSVGRSSFPGVVGAQALSIFGSEVAFAGLTESAAEKAGLKPMSVTIDHTTRSPHDPGSSPITVRLIFSRIRGRLLGIQMIGGPGTALRADVLIPLLRARASVQDLYDVDLIYAPPFSPRLDPLLVAAGKALRALKSQN